jgi:transcriptional regulator with XRE-family HTH domain
MTRKQFGRKIRRRRIALKLSARSAAKAAGISHVYLAEIEAGSLPSQSVAESLAKALDDDSCCSVWFHVAISEADESADELRAAQEKWESVAGN